MSWRRFSVLVSWLPRESAYVSVSHRAANTYTAENASDYFAQFKRAGE